MPYAVLDPDCFEARSPSVADLREIAAAETAPTALLIVDYALESFEPLAGFSALKTLKVLGASDLATLTGLDSLQELGHLSIAPPPAWQRSTRCIEIDSYRPFASCRSLERLTLLRVRPRDLDLAPIATLHGLRELHIAGVPELTLEHYATLAAALPKTQGRCLQPYTSISASASADAAKASLCC